LIALNLSKKLAEKTSVTDSRPEKPEAFSVLLFCIVASIHGIAFYGATRFFSFSGLIVLAVFHAFFSIFGISLGYHRFFSHRSFRASTYTEVFLAVAATLCLQGGVLYWATLHRAHHIWSERTGDAHSAARGFWWAHIGWLFYYRPNGFSFRESRKYTTDLADRQYLKIMNEYQLPLNFSFLALLAAGFAAVNRLDLFFWAGPIRIVTVWHATWLINSLSHGASISGGKPSGLINHILPDLVLGGEGWHRAHHERPGLLTHRSRWHFDIGYWVLVVFEQVGLVELPQQYSYKKSGRTKL
jgi:fatty-acid desaturase